MKFINNAKETTIELDKAIETCKQIAATSSREAKRNVEFIKESITLANRQVEECIKDISHQKVRNPEILHSIAEQLKRMKSKFFEEYEEVEQLVNKKIKEANRFNITLFGRTKVGKSTLMEILTHGDGSSIGKGGQRTTLDVRQYQWKGLTITDIPGIDAFQGSTDDKIAFEAAKSADIVLFMISDGQPEATEADWLVKLKREDKPIICLCNVKYTLSDELDLQIFLDNPNDILKDERINEIITQFNAFVKAQLPQEHIKIYVSQLQARYLADQKAYASKRKALISASRFNSIEYEIQQMVIKNGISFRRKCFLSIIDSPLFSQSLEMFHSSALAYQNYLLAKEKMNDFCNWQNGFVVEERTQLLQRIDQIYNRAIATIPTFVEENIESNYFKQNWESHLKDLKIGQNIEREFAKSISKAKNKVDQLFAALETESQMQTKMNIQLDSNLGKADITNWKRRWGWAGAIAAGVGTATELGLIMALGTSAAAIPVVGWAFGIATLACGFFSWLCDSREDKLRRARREREQALQEGMRKNQMQTKNTIFKAYQKSLIDGLLSDSYNRFYVITTTLLTLTNSQRELGFKYLKHHADISKQIVQAALYDLGVKSNILDHIEFVARIPGKKTLIGCTDPNLGNVAHAISEKIGNREEVWIYKKNLTNDFDTDLHSLCSYFHLWIPMKSINVSKGGFHQHVVFIHNSTPLSENGKNNIILLQQILNIHIINR